MSVMVAVGIASRGPARPRGTLPAAPNSLVGRDDDLAALVRLLTDPATRLVTLTGPPGVGKTRLAVAVATAVGDRFRDGVVFVDLTAIRDPALVPFELAAVLGVDAAGDPSDTLARALRAKHVLVVLDNFEHVLDAAATLVGPLDACPGLRLLVTSRERLHLHAEREVPVQPLALPADDMTDPDRFAATPAVAMLLERVRAFQSGFAVTSVNREALAEICVRLDGLPLAIELAAARLKLFTPGELTFRLRHRMKLLTGGARDIPDRHRTLRAALAWSHDLLSADERALFRRLSVFVGGWTLEGAQAVCVDGDRDVVDTMASLVDKSLIRRTRRGDLAEFSMLESLREYAAERLADHGEDDATCDRHARYFADLSRWAESTIGTAEERASLYRVGFEEANLRAALEHALRTRRTEWALPLASAIGWYSYTRGRLGDGLATLDRTLQSADGAPAPDHDGVAGALLIAAIIAFGSGDLDRADVLLGRALQVNTATRRTAIASAFLGHLARTRGEHEAAVAHHERAAALHGELGNAPGVDWSRYDLGLLARRRGDLDGAAGYLRASLDRFRQMDYVWGAACVACALATVELRKGRADETAALLAEAMDGFEDIGDGRGIAQCLEAAAALAAARRDCEKAARLLGAAGLLRERLAAPLPDEDRAAHDALTQRVRRALGPQTAERARREGREMPQTAAIAAARAAVTEPIESPGVSDPLTRREREVALLVARGRTNRQIGRALGIAEKTTEVHVHNIIGKLGACSRAEVAAWVASREHDPYMVPPISPRTGQPYT